ncbi:hypothetical protein ScPMuIL_003177 [Solemya velum]
MVAIDEKEHADRIAAAEAMSALSSMVILSTPTSVASHENVRVVTRGTSPINIVRNDGKTRKFELTQNSDCARGIPENACVPKHQPREIRRVSRASPTTSNNDGKLEEKSPTNSFELGIVLLSTETKNENDSREKTLPLKKRALAREEFTEMDDTNAANISGNETPGGPMTPRLPSGTEVISGGSQPRSQDLSVYRPVPVNPAVSVSAWTELAFVWKVDEDGDLPLHIAVVHENITLVERFVHIMTTVAGRSVDKFNKTQQVRYGHQWIPVVYR